MKKLLLVATGAGIGYVLGARAGRPAYDRIVDAFGRVTAPTGFDRTQQATLAVIDDAKDASEQLRDKVDSRLAHTVDKVGSVITSPPTAAHTAAESDLPVTLPDTLRAKETRSSDMANGF